MKLTDLLAAIPGITRSRGNMETEIHSLTADSRETVDRGLFFCISGQNFDAHLFAPQAEHNGCVALIVSCWVEDSDLPQVCVVNVRSAMAYAASLFFGKPACDLCLLGITGTKGKTTTSFLLKSILEAAGHRTGLIGTTGNMIQDKKLKSNLTTPDPIDLHRCFQQMRAEDVDVVSMEVSAHAIHMHRLDGLTFEAACYTNLSQDHLDYFGTMERYFYEKKSIFINGSVRNAALNADDETTKDILADIKIPFLTYGISADADVFARDIEITENGVSFDIFLLGLEHMRIHMRMTGMFNVYNALAAATMALMIGINREAIQKGLEAVRAVPGRIEMLDTNTPYKVILDYSHSPDALENILTTVRMFTKNRVISLFGCGGDRDQGKRAQMGEISGRLADYSIITSDNPRNENPYDILREIEKGIEKTNARYITIENRREAIGHALQIAKEGDAVVLAGKGHETYQDIMGTKRPFDEKVVVQELLMNL